MTVHKNKTALITGASGGIGYEMALICAKNKHDLVLVARSEDKLQDLKSHVENDFDIKVHVYVMDLSVPGKAKELYDECHKHRIAVDILVNNAGYGDYQNVAESNSEVYANLLNLNIIALTELTTLFVKDMVKRGSGRILNLGSTAAYQPVPRLAVYAASKSYVVNFTEALHAELKGTGVSATILSPGVTATGFVDRAKMGNSSLAQSAQASPKDVAEAGYKAMMKGKLYVIPGILNKLLAFSTRIMPSRRGVLAVSGLFSKEKK